MECGNSRKINPDFSDAVFYTADEGDRCEPGVPDSIKDLLADRIRESKKDQTVVMSKIDGEEPKMPGHVVKIT